MDKYYNINVVEYVRKQCRKKVLVITSRVHPGETPSSFVCQGIINYTVYIVNYIIRYH